MNCHSHNGARGPLQPLSRRPPATPRRGLRQRLREATRPAHRDLEALLPLSTGALDLPTYQDHLAFLASFHEPVEVRLQAVSALRRLVPDIDQRWKTPRLRRDLGGAWPRGRPLMAALPAASDPAAGLGVFYVFEGATLGARTLLPKLRAAGLVPGPTGTAYLTGYGPAGGVMWRRFCDALERVHEEAQQQVVTAAVETFDAMIAWRHSWIAGRD